MAERYVITGVQLGMLIALKDEYDRSELVDTIITHQHIGVTYDTDVQQDCETLRSIWKSR